MFHCDIPTLRTVCDQIFLFVIIDRNIFFSYCVFAIILDVKKSYSHFHPFRKCSTFGCLWRKVSAIEIRLQAAMPTYSMSSLDGYASYIISCVYMCLRLPSPVRHKIRHDLEYSYRMRPRGGGFIGISIGCQKDCAELSCSRRD